MSVRASMIVCTCNRPASLARTVASLLADSSRVPRELLVVDNGDQAHAEEVAALLRDLAPSAPLPVRPLRQRTPGKSHALNLAVAQARGEILLFTDDDVEVADGWADALVACFEDDAVGLAGGRTLAAWPSAPPAWLSARVLRSLGIRDPGETAGPLVPEDVVGANMAVRALVLAARTEPFDTRLGPRAGMKVDYEDLVLATEVARTRRVVYTPIAVAHHHVEPERLRVDWLRRMNFQRGFGWAHYETVTGSDNQVSVFTALRRAAFYYPRTALLRARHREQGFGPAAADRELDGFMVAGRYLGRLLWRWPGLTRWAARHLA